MPTNPALPIITHPASHHPTLTYMNKGGGVRVEMGTFFFFFLIMVMDGGSYSVSGVEV